MFDVQAEPGYNEQANSLDTVRYITQLRLNKIAYHETFYNEFTMYRFITKDTWIPQKSKLDNVGSNFFLCLAAIHPVTNIGVLDTQDRAGLLHPQLVSAEYQYSASTAESAREKNIAKRKAPWTLHSWCWHNEFNNQNFSTLSGSYFTWVTKFQEFNIKKKKKKRLSRSNCTSKKTERSHDLIKPFGQRKFTSVIKNNNFIAELERQMKLRIPTRHKRWGSLVWKHFSA